MKEVGHLAVISRRKKKSLKFTHMYHDLLWAYVTNQKSSFVILEPNVVKLSSGNKGKHVATSTN